MAVVQTLQYGPLLIRNLAIYSFIESSWFVVNETLWHILLSCSHAHVFKNYFKHFVYGYSSKYMYLAFSPLADMTYDAF